MELDIEVIKNGPICKYHKNSVLDRHLNWFSDHRFEVLDIETRNWTPENIHRKIKESFSFPDYYGENLDAFNDCLGDMYNEKYAGLVIVFRHYDQLVSLDNNLAKQILDIIATTSWLWLLKGKKLIGLVQSDNPDLCFSKLGGKSPDWNSEEWFDSERKK